MTGPIITCVPDIFFMAKIRETAKALGITIVAHDVGRSPAAVAESEAQAVIVDLNSCGSSALDWICTLKSDPATHPIPIVGFASHVQQELINAALEAGCNTVLARSAFTQKLPSLLKSLAKRDGAENP